jgi:hypothetical protein
MTNPIEIQTLTYADTDDRAWQELMQKPETQDMIRMQFLNKEFEDWPNQIFLASMPQVPEEQLTFLLKKWSGGVKGPCGTAGMSR